MKEILYEDYSDFTEIVTWPESQLLMDKVGFHENCVLINSETGLEKYGSSAYRVNPEWLNKVRSGEIKKGVDDSIDDHELMVDYTFYDLENE